MVSPAHRADGAVREVRVMVTTTARAGRMRRFSERLLLGTVMALIARIIDRRLRRVFKAQARR